MSVPVTTGLEVHWDADALSLSDGDEVTSFTDQSGNGHHATGAGPTFKTNMLNGRPVVRFDGVDDYLSTDHDSALQIARPTVLAVMRVFNPTDSWGLLVGYPDDIIHEEPWFRWSIMSTGETPSEVQVRWNPSRAGDSEIGDPKDDAWWSEWGVWKLYESGGTVYVERGAEELVTESDGDIDYPNDVGIHIAAGAGGSDTAELDVAEVLIYDHSLSSQDLDAVETYLDDKWLTEPVDAQGRFALSGGLYAPAYLKGGAKVPVYAKGGLKLP